MNLITPENLNVARQINDAVSKRAEEIFKYLLDNNLIFHRYEGYKPFPDYYEFTHCDDFNINFNCAQYGRRGGDDENFTYTLPLDYLYLSNDEIFQKETRKKQEWEADVQKQKELEKQEEQRQKEEKEKEEYIRLKQKFEKIS